MFLQSPRERTGASLAPVGGDDVLQRSQVEELDDLGLVERSVQCATRR
jgi:hypothetical protein